MSICTSYRDKHRERAALLSDLISRAYQRGFHGRHQIHIWTRLVTGYLHGSANCCLNIPKWFNWFPDFRLQLGTCELWPSLWRHAVTLQLLIPHFVLRLYKHGCSCTNVLMWTILIIIIIKTIVLKNAWMHIITETLYKSFGNAVLFVLFMSLLILIVSI